MISLVEEPLALPTPKRIVLTPNNGEAIDTVMEAVIERFRNTELYRFGSVDCATGIIEGVTSEDYSTQKKIIEVCKLYGTVEMSDT